MHSVKRLGFTVVKNALANIVRGGASAIVAIALPHFLTHALSVDRFAAWVLMLQIAACSNYLDFGIQTAIARFVAQAMERGDDERRDRIVSTALAFLILAAALALLISALVVWIIPHLFHGAPLHLIGELRGGVMVLSAGAAILLPLSTFTGILVGLHRNEYPALAIGTTRLLGAGAVLMAIHFTSSLVVLACCIAGFNLLGGLVQYLFCSRLLPGMRIRPAFVTRAMAGELLHYCIGLTAFSFGMLLVGGLDLTVVGYFSFGNTGYYAIASTAIAFMVGIGGSVYSALMTPLAVLQERGDHERIRNLILSSTRLGSYASLALIALVLLAGRPMLTFWVGPVYAQHALPVLEVLLWAQALRLTGSAYSVALVATAQQNYGIGAALAEGLTNLAASVLGAHFLGPIGVAWGTLAGAFCGVLWVLLHVMTRVREIPVDRLAFMREAFFRPTFCLLPILGYAVLRSRPHLSLAEAGATGLAVLLTALLLFRFGQIPRFSITRAAR
jgi:O-antigen/teichoic acid export membrane protein